MNSSNLYARDHIPRLERLQLPHTQIDDLRHLHATYLVAEGVDPRTAADRLGRSSPSFTLRVYAHAPAAQQRAAIVANDLLVKRVSSRALSGCSEFHISLEPATRFELVTCALRVRCSATELRRPALHRKYTKGLQRRQQGGLTRGPRSLVSGGDAGSHRDPSGQRRQVSTTSRIPATSARIGVSCASPKKYPYLSRPTIIR